MVKRPVEQANIIMGCPTIVATDERRYVMSVLNAVLGGGMSSRLFQEIREKRGLVYSTYSFASSYADAGYFGMYAGCTPSKVRQVLELLGAELDKLAAGGISDDELRKAVGQLCGGIVLALEDTGSRMSRLGRAELVSGEYQDIDETLRLIKAVTAAEVQELARELAAAPRTVTVVGPFEESRNLRALSARGALASRSRHRTVLDRRRPGVMMVAGSLGRNAWTGRCQAVHTRHWRSFLGQLAGTTHWEAIAVGSGTLGHRGNDVHPRRRRACRHPELPPHRSRRHALRGPRCLHRGPGPPRNALVPRQQHGPAPGAPARGAWQDGTLTVERRSDRGTARHTFRVDEGVLTHTAGLRLGQAADFQPFMTSICRRA